MSIGEFQHVGDLYVGTDIGGTKIIVQIIDRHGHVLLRHKTKTSRDLNHIIRVVEECIVTSKVDEDRIAGFGFGVPGVTNIHNGVVIDAPAMNWHNVAFVEQMQAVLKKPVTVENDVNCAALGERWLGSAQSLDNFVFIAIGTGVGAAIVTGGNLLHGSQYMAGEIGYMLAEEDWQSDKRYTFKSLGALEEKISGKALSNHQIRLDSIIQQYKEEQGEGYEIISRYLNTLSITIANMASVLNPQKVILGGGISKTLTQLLHVIREQVGKMTPVPVQIECSVLGENAGSYGAAALLISKLTHKGNGA